MVSNILPEHAKDMLSSLKWFGKTEGTFPVAFGGDGCPFGKNESACSFLVSFLNTGKRVTFSSDDFLVFGGNVEENSLVVKRYINSVCKQIVDLENTLFEINGLHVRFHFEELPNDMKMLAMLGGELSNSATYFSSFANVNTKVCTDLKGTLGSGPLCKWKPWDYGNRTKVVQAVNSFKASLDAKPLPLNVTTVTIEDYNARCVASQRRRNLRSQRSQLVDGETRFILCQQGGFDDACKLKTMFTKYN